MNKTDQAYLEDIIDAIFKINTFVEGMNSSDFEADEKTLFAVCHALEIIGEAANKLSTVFSDSNPDFPIKKAVEMRNFLIHGYDQINPKIVWKTVKENLPELMSKTKSASKDLNS